MSDWLELTAEQKAGKIANLMGAGGDSWLVLGFSEALPAWKFPDGALVAKRDYRPTEDIAQAWAVQERITTLGLEVEWTTHLMDLLPFEVLDRKTLGEVARATADARCHAAVLAMEEIANE